MVHKRRDFLITFTILCLAMCACSGFQYLGSAFYGLVWHRIHGLGSGGARLLSGLFDSPWTGVLVQYIFSIGVPFLLVVPMTCFVRSDRRPAHTLPAEVWMSALFMCLGLGYIFNFLGVFLDVFFSIFTGVPATDMNPVMDALDELTPGMVIYTCLIAPFMEEFIFRGVLLKKARRFGDRTAVVFCAVMFGLMHGNLNQCLYAVVIGLILGYIMAKIRFIERLIMPFVIIIQTAPKISLAPLFILWMGLGIESKAALVILVVSFPIMINEVSAIRSIEDNVYNLMKVLKASKWQTFCKIEVPYSIEMMLSGIKLALTQAMTGAVIGEMIGAKAGLGYLLTLGSETYDIKMILNAVILLSVIGLALYLISELIEKKALYWKVIDKSVVG